MLFYILVNFEEVHRDTLRPGMMVFIRDRDKRVKPPEGMYGPQTVVSIGGHIALQNPQGVVAALSTFHCTFWQPMPSKEYRDAAKCEGSQVPQMLE